MPVLLSVVNTDVNRVAQISFVSGTLFPGQLSELWSEVKYDGKTEYWMLHPSMLNSDGKSLSIQFDPFFSGKTLEIRFYGFDTAGKQTAFTNPVTIHVQ